MLNCKVKEIIDSNNFMRYPAIFTLIILVVALSFCSLFIFFSDSSSDSPTRTNWQLQRIIADNNSNNKTGSLTSNIDFKTDSILPVSADKEDIQPHFKDDKAPINLGSTTCMVIDRGSGSVLLKQNENKMVPIASISKLATALVWLEQNINWNGIYQVKSNDMVGGGKSNIAAGEKVKIKDLFFLSLTASDNSATEALAHTAGMTDAQFVNLINKDLKEWGLDNTHFSDPTGLSDNNISTAADVAKLAQLAFAKKEIREATLTKQYSFVNAAGVSKSAQNTDLLLDIFPRDGIKIVGGKTGHTDSAGYCFVGQFVNEGGHEVISVVLGGPDINSRFAETKHLISWTYGNYLW